MDQFEIKVDEAKLSSGNYFEPLNISEERKVELINHVYHSLVMEKADQVTSMIYLSKSARSLEELVFLNFKLGEFVGILESGHDPMLPVTTSMSLAVYKMGLDS